jgi:hypothetical protein
MFIFLRQNKVCFLYHKCVVNQLHSGGNMVNHVQTKKICLVLKYVEDNSGIYVEHFVICFVKEHNFFPVY